MGDPLFRWSLLPGSSSLLTVPNSIFVVCLLCSDLIQGMSGYFQFVWAAEGRVFEGGLCTAQAAMLLFGDNGTAIWWVVA